MVFHPRARVGDESKARRVALGKAVLSEAPDLLEDAFGELPRDALPLHPADEPLPVALDPAGLSPRGHVTPQLIRLAGGVVGGDHGQADDLLLEERHSQRLPQNRLQRRVGIDHGLLTRASPEVRVHHAAGDRAGPHDADLHDEIVIGPGLQAGEHRHLGAAFDLEHSDRVGAADHVEGGTITGRDAGHGVRLAVVLLEEIEAQMELVECAQSQEVHLEEAQLLDAVLVPLDDGAVRHGAVLDGDQMADRLMAEQEPTGMDGEVTGKVEDLVRESEEVLVDGKLGVESRTGENFGRHRLVGREYLGQTIESGLGQSQRLPHVPHRRARAVADDVGDHGGVGAAILLVHVLDDLLATGVLDVEVDVRGLRALARHEALEEKLHLDRIHRGDPQTVADRGVGGGAPALTEDALLTTEPDDLPHGEEVTAVVQIVDDLELLLELGAHRLRNRARGAPGRALEGELAQPLRRRRAVGELLRWVAVANLIEREPAACRDLESAPHGSGIVGEESIERLRRLQGVLGIGLGRASRRAHRHSAANTGQDVLQLPPRAAVVENLEASDHGQTVPFGAPAQASFLLRFPRPPVASGESVEAVVEGITETSGDEVGLGEARKETPIATPERHEVAGVRADLFPRDGALPLGRPTPPQCDELAEMGVARAAHREKDQRRAVPQ